jgi:type II secretory pathway pseudopilin PulG
MKKHYVNNEKGFSIMEILMYLTIAAILLGGIFTFVKMAKSGSDLRAAKQNVAAVHENIYNLFSAQGLYTNLDNTLAIRAGVFPETMIRGNSAVNVWNGDVTVASAGDPHRTFTITYDDVPQDEAVELATFNNGQWDDVTLNGTSIPQVIDRETEGAVDPVSTATGAVTAGPTNTLVFTSLR